MNNYYKKIKMNRGKRQKHQFSLKFYIFNALNSNENSGNCFKLMTVHLFIFNTAISMRLTVLRHSLQSIQNDVFAYVPIF